MSVFVKGLVHYRRAGGEGGRRGGISREGIGN